jgi:hypothetical protein
MPPIDGLQLIAPSVSRLCVMQQRPASHARRSQRSLGAGMAATDDDHVETVRKEHGQSAFLARGENPEKSGILRQFSER